METGTLPPEEVSSADLFFLFCVSTGAFEPKENAGAKFR